MIFNSQGAAQKKIYINGGTIIPGAEAIVLPKGAELLGDLTIEAADTEAAYEEGYNAGQSAGYQTGYETGYADGAESVPPGLDLSLFGCTKYAVDTFTVTSNTYSIDIKHSLGEVPKLAIISASRKVNGMSSTQRAVYRALMSTLDGTEKAGWVASLIDSSGNHKLFTYGDDSYSYFDAKATYLQWWGSLGGYYAYFMTGVEYTLVTAA